MTKLWFPTFLCFSEINSLLYSLVYHVDQGWHRRSHPKQTPKVTFTRVYGCWICMIPDCCWSSGLGQVRYKDIREMDFMLDLCCQQDRQQQPRQQQPRFNANTDRPCVIQCKVYWPKLPFHVRIKSEICATSKLFFKFDSELEGRAHKLERENRTIFLPTAKLCILVICPKLTNAES